MIKDEDLKLFFKNIEIVLRKYSPSELNKAILEVLNKKQDKAIEISFILQTTATQYNTSVNILKQKNCRGENITNAKQMAYCLLKHRLDMSLRQISKNVFDNNHVSVDKGIKRLQNCDKNIKSDREFLEIYDKLSTIVNNFIIEQNQLNHNK